VRLASCVAIELGTLSLFGVTAAFALLWGLDHVRLGEAQAAELVAPRAVFVAEPAAPAIAVGREPELQWHGPIASGTFLGVSDQELLEPLRTGEVVAVKFNRGGSSISLRVDFDNGARCAFKPAQTNYQTVPRKEVAAYRISRLLGLSSVQPAIGRAFPAEQIFTSVTASSREYLPRLRSEIIREQGMIVGELSWWIPTIQSVMVDGFPVDSVDGIVSLKRYLDVGATIPEEQRTLMRQISNMLVFDFLINNSDRWSGGNVKVSEDGETLFFMDNTLSFSPHPRAERRVRLYLQRTRTFSRRLIEALRNLDEDVVRQALAEDPGAFEFLLTEQEIDAMFSRRDIALAYVDELIAQHGEKAVLVFP